MYKKAIYEVLEVSTRVKQVSLNYFLQPHLLMKIANKTELIGLKNYVTTLHPYNITFYKYLTMCSCFSIF